MQFDLSSKYRVRTETHNVILETRHIAKANAKREGGNEYWTQSYFASFRALLDHLVHRGIARTESTSKLEASYAEWAHLIESMPAKVFAAVDESIKAPKRKLKEELDAGNQ